MNEAEFRVAVARAGLTNRDIATSLGISEQAFYNKAAGKTEFKSSEIKKLAVILSLSMDAVNHIFFDDTVN